MPKKWRNLCGDWLEKTQIPQDAASWAAELLSESELNIDNLLSVQNKESSDIYNSKKERNKELKKSLRIELSNYQELIDDIDLSPSNSCKVQLSVPSSLHYLMKAWATAEGRDLSSVAMQCLELGLREIRDKEAIPIAAIRKYNIACEKRMALAELTNLIDTLEENSNTSIY